MFCVKCGKELQEEWIICPNCGTVLKEKCDENNLKTDLNEGDSKIRSREEIKGELIAGAFSDKSGVILSYGASAVSKDMTKELCPGEEILWFCHAYRNSILGQLKNLRMFRNYIVCTNQRMIYIETGCMAFSLIPFLRKVISFPYKEITNVVSDKRLGIFSGKMIIESASRKSNFAIIDRGSAEELRDFIKNKM